MTNPTRTKASVRNAFVGVITQALVLLLSFFARTVFVKQLGAEYLGLNSLFTSILALLSLIELGLGAAFTYALYRPIQDRDVVQIRTIVKYAGRLYRRIACLVAIAAALTAPFLKFMSDVPGRMGDVYGYYAVFMASGILGFLFADRSLLLLADQRMHIVRAYTAAFDLLRVGAQVFVLVVYQSYWLFLLIQLLATMANGLAAYVFSRRLYPYIRRLRGRASVSTAQRSALFSDVRDLSVYRIGGVAMNQTDAILISTIAGTSVLGVYSNYALIIGSALTIAEVLFLAITASVGDYMVRAEPKEKELLFRAVELAGSWVFGLLSALLLVLIGPFIEAWLGSDYTLGWEVAVPAVVNFYLYGLLSPIGVLRVTTGLFRRTRSIFIVTALLNLGLSIVLGWYYGVAGILCATLISRLATQVWYEPKALYQTVFHTSPRAYFRRQAFAATTVAASAGLALTIPVSSASFGSLALRGFVGFVAFNFFFTVGNFRSPAFKFTLTRVRTLHVPRH